jgi:hypothetical protein
LIEPTARHIAGARTALAALSLGTAVTLIAACGATTPAGLGSLPTLPIGSASTPSAAVGPTTGNIGDTLSMVDSGGDVAQVTLVNVFDPPTGYDPNATPPDGTRWVAFEGTIVIDGDRAGQDADEFEVIGSDGQTYGVNTSYFLNVFDGCSASNIEDVKSGQTQTICSAVGVPPGVTVAKVGYSTEGVNTGAPAKLFWTVTSDTGPPTTPTPDDSAPTATPTPTPDDIGPTPTPTPTSDDNTPTASPTPSPTPTASS